MPWIKYVFIVIVVGIIVIVPTAIIWFICSTLALRPKERPRSENTSRRASSENSIAAPPAVARLRGPVAVTYHRGNESSPHGALSSADIANVDVQPAPRTSCGICHLEFCRGDRVWSLSCRHPCHQACLEEWLVDVQICPVCAARGPGHLEWTYGVPQQPENLSSRASSTDANHPETQSEAPEYCPICREEYKRGDRIAGLPCMHQYHGACVEPWIASRRCCPYCQQPVAGMPESWTY